MPSGRHHLVAMSIGDDALRGTPEKIPGRHTFEVPQDGVLKGKGVYICHRSRGQEQIGKDTGDGWDVWAKDRVEVYNVTVHFVWK
ncbi:hypothetical protein TOPH_07456 [Tolypocladium ophioglossoides CBS 100239]|uniref:Uncharacterized protein n=1 Tax=Tolypocladium ophioglossoides (strain CBS 100239) TaxID=1163406 RepID=A0A0L0N1Y1_TOLOC|nr:hypothetical protein TOPH_07456 [Tolypocladium ophioglossoides CBS 100239]